MRRRVRSARPRNGARAFLLLQAQCFPTAAGLFLQLPLRTENENNEHEHWRSRHKRSQMQKVVTRAVLGGRTPPTLPCRVTFEVVRPRLLDTDGASASCKFVRDAIAAWLGCGDSPRDPITWVYLDQLQMPKTYGVRVTIREDRP